MKKLRLAILLLLVVTGTCVTGQQFPISSHYFVNPYSLNPAFAGAFNRSELFMNFRNDWSDIEGSPQTFRINGFVPVVKNMYLGGEVYADFADIFYRLKAGLSYTYRLEVGDEQNLSFGLAGQFYQGVIRLDQANVDLDDPVLRNLDRLFNSSFNSSFGLVYNHRNLHVAFGMPVMFRTKDAYSNSSIGKFAFERAYDFYVLNRFNIHQNWDFQPSILFRKTVNQPMIFDVSTMFIYDNQLWMGVLYRNTSLFGFSIGGRVLNGLLLHYTFEAGVGGIHRFAGNSHEISIAFTRLHDDNRTVKGRSGRGNRIDIREQPSKEKLKEKKRKEKEKKRIQKARVKKTVPSRSLKYAPYEKY